MLFLKVLLGFLYEQKTIPKGDNRYSTSAATRSVHLRVAYQPNPLIKEDTLNYNRNPSMI